MPDSRDHVQFTCMPRFQVHYRRKQQDELSVCVCVPGINLPHWELNLLVVGQVPTRHGLLAPPLLLFPLNASLLTVWWEFPFSHSPW